MNDYEKIRETVRQLAIQSYNDYLSYTKEKAHSFATAQFDRFIAFSQVFNMMSDPESIDYYRKLYGLKEVRENAERK